MINKLTDWLGKYRTAGGGRTKRPYQLFQIEPTLQCALNCVMCPWSEMRATAGTMTWQTFERIAPYLPLAESVDLTGGGEPSLSPYLPEMVRAARQAGCVVGFSSNAARLTPELSQLLLAQDVDPKLAVDWLSFSVDAATPELYERIRQGASFDMVIGNIRYLNELKKSLDRKAPRLMMVFVMMGGEVQPENTNYHQLPQFIELAHSLGVEQVIAKNLDVILKDEDDHRRLFSHSGTAAPEVAATLEQARQRAKKLGVHLRTYALRPEEQTMCEHQPVHNLFFNWQGEVSPCITLSYAEERVFDGQRVLTPCQRFGNINQESLAEIWEKPAYQEFRQMYHRRLNWQRQAMLDQMLGQTTIEDAMPPAPEGCQTCYYLYGI